MERTPSEEEVWWFSLTSTVAKIARPLNSSASRLYTGLIIWHGPHDTEKKSTMTGSPVFSLWCLRSFLKSECVRTSMMLRAHGARWGQHRRAGKREQDGGARARPGARAQPRG